MKIRKTRWYLKRLVYVLMAMTTLGTLCILFSKPVFIWIDNYSIKNLKQELEENFIPGNADSLISFISNFNLDGYTKPVFVNDVKINSRTEWSLKNEFSENLIEEEASFASLNTNLIPYDSATFYIYRKSDIKNSKVVLWVPGLGVSDVAFRFIKHLFIIELEKGYTVVVYIPPFHIKRKHPEKENGEGFISSNLQQNLQLQLEAVRELRTMLEYLENQEPKEISAWGGSMGASFLLLTSKFHNFKHINLMIPMVDWERTMMQNKELKLLIPKYLEAGIDSSLLAQAFKILSPANYELNLPSKTQIQLAEYDQLTSKSKIMDFARKNKIVNVISYPRGHATILFTKKLYRDYEIFLEF
ncbi:MAG: hypothetical protein HC831_05225 [Chloroflexia bacterium]|nr:hypothetical protein [Chloroflexia bacterium]